MGQITLETEFGKELKKLGADNQYSFFVEVGAWDGQGSTACLWEGMKGRTDNPHLVSFEANQQWWRVASNHWRDCSGVEIIWGRIAERMMTDKEVRDHPLFEAIKVHYTLHFAQDEIDFKAAPLFRVLQCDVAVLDGGEFCGWWDWEAVKSLSPKVVALDDIKLMKNSAVLESLLSEGWTMSWVSSERNGAAILRAPESTP